MRLRGRVLAIGGSDSGGGAGIQADLKTVLALGAHGASAITAVTVQDTVRVHAVHALPPALVAAQVACVLADPGADAVKTGMLVDAATIGAVVAVLEGQGAAVPLVVDPVLAATSGEGLLRDDAVAALTGLFRRAALVTPNVPEAARLTGVAIGCVDDMRRAAAVLLGLGAGAVLVKGGHLDGDEVTDVLAMSGRAVVFRHWRVATRHDHGTGCTLAAACAAGLAQGMELEAAVARARAYVRLALAEAPELGAGRGPLNHAAGLTLRSRNN
jgi:hydroxymethylpyrimidine/phosphomethylpyrimidine kinase